MDECSYRIDATADRKSEGELYADKNADELWNPSIWMKILKWARSNSIQQTIFTVNRWRDASLGEVR